MVEHCDVVITTGGVAAAVLMSADDYDSLQETIDVLTDENLARDLREALDDADAGRLVSHDAVIADLADRREPQAAGPDD